MQVRFWGTRGSLPCSAGPDNIRAKVRKALLALKGRALATEQEVDRFLSHNLPFAVTGAYGGNTPCVEIKGGDTYILCDAGTGIRDFANCLAKKGKIGPAKPPLVFHLFLSHLHWDHIQGFPFFLPAYMPGHTIHIHGCHPDMEKALAGQQESPWFPVPFSALAADIRFDLLKPGEQVSIAGLEVTPFSQNHPGDSFGFRFEKNGKKLIYSTDSEHKEEAESADYPFLKLISQADLLIFDAQYNLMDAMGPKENWGHSSNLLAVELSVLAGVKRLCLFHHEHTCDDEALEAFLASTKNYLKFHAAASELEILLAHDGLELDV